MDNDDTREGEIVVGKEEIFVFAQGGTLVLPVTSEATEVRLDRLHLTSLDISPLAPGDKIYEFSLQYNGVFIETIDLSVLSWKSFGNYVSSFDMEGTHVGYLDLRPLNPKSAWASPSPNTVHSANSYATLPIADEPIDITPLVELNTWIHASEKHHLKCSGSTFASRFNDNASSLLASAWEYSDGEYTEEDYNRDIQKKAEHINEAIAGKTVNWDNDWEWNDNFRGDRFISGKPRIDIY